ncbi:MAG TPA: DegV family protein [Solirubrobacterales bacterium]|nr:DegV family protein [Solirubrobacterales bacterium]
MPSTAVVADTTSYLTPELLERHDVHLVSLYVGIEGEQERESDIADLQGFYERLRKSGEAVSTSQPSVGDFIAVYEPLLAEGREIVSIHLASGISGTYESAIQARERLTADDKGGERIVVVDSRTGAGGMGLMIMGAARAAERGAGAAEAAERAEAVRGELKIWFAVDTLDYLRRGGRIGAARAWIGTTLKIKPILTLEQEITPVERVRTRSRAFERLVGYARQRHEAGADAWVVQHVQDPENAERLIEACRPVFGCDPVFTSEVGPVIGAHVGPGLLGVGGVSKRVLEA